MRALEVARGTVPGEPARSPRLCLCLDERIGTRIQG